MQRLVCASVRRAPVTRSPHTNAALLRAPLSLSARSLATQPHTNSSSHSNPSHITKRSFLRRHPMKIGAVVALGAGAAYFSSKSSASSSKQPIPYPPFNIDLFRGFKSLEDFKKGADIVLYQYETCPFCNKVRAFLDYNGIRYRSVEVNPLSKKEMAGNPITKDLRREVPVLTINGIALQNSTPIVKNVNDIMNLYRKPNEQHVVTPQEESDLSFVDNRLVNLTAVNLYRSWSESVESFQYINKHSQFSGMGGELNKWVGAVVMRLLTKYKLNKKYNVTDPRQMLYQASNEWIAGNAGRPFRGGSSPNLADLTAFGVYRALSPYATGRDVMNPANTSPEFVRWFEAMTKEVEAGALKSKA